MIVRKLAVLASLALCAVQPAFANKTEPATPAIADLASVEVVAANGKPLVIPVKNGQLQLAVETLRVNGIEFAAPGDVAGFTLKNGTTVNLKGGVVLSSDGPLTSGQPAVAVRDGKLVPWVAPKK